PFQKIFPAGPCLCYNSCVCKCRQKARRRFRTFILIKKKRERRHVPMRASDDKKITVLGLGGVGGYVGALLADAYPHVTFVARGERGKSIRENGLILHSDYRGERTVRPERVVETAEGLEIQDYIFICVKNYSLEEACRSLTGCVSEDTVIVPVMNGADPGDRAREYLPGG